MNGSDAPLYKIKMSSFYDLPKEHQHKQLEAALQKYGRINPDQSMSGMCADVFRFYLGENTSPQWVAVKVPNGRPRPEDSAKRFLREIRIQHGMFSHFFVHHACDVARVMDVPVAIYRLWDGDLSNLIPNKSFSITARLGFAAYLCSALEHCHSKGINCHQDLKPQNILARDLTRNFEQQSSDDVFIFPKLADFGLANVAQDFGIFDGAKPYMAPEQWGEIPLSPATDVFSLGIIIFELLTYGIHPIGGITADFWPTPKNGNSKAWTRSDKWKKWVKDGIPISSHMFICEGMKEIVMASLEIDVAKRPTITDVQESLLKAIKKLSGSSYQQADFQIKHYNSTASDPDSAEWPAFKAKLEALEHSFASG